MGKPRIAQRRDLLVALSFDQGQQALKIEEHRLLYLPRPGHVAGWVLSEQAVSTTLISGVREEQLIGQLVALLEQLAPGYLGSGGC